MRGATRVFASGLLALSLAFGVVPALSAVAYADEPGDSQTSETTAVVEISTAEELAKAIANQADGQTWNLQPGTYDLTEDLMKEYAAQEINGETEFYFPITADNLTINGGGATVTSSYYQENGVWHYQNFITVGADNVTIDNLNVSCKKQVNKAIEVLGADFTLTNSTILPVEDGNSGSIYFNGAFDLGDATIKNVTVSSWIATGSIPADSDDTVTVDGVTIDFSENGYAADADTYVPVRGNVTVAEGGLTVKVGSNLSSLSAVTTNLPEGTTVELTGDVTVHKTAYISANNVTIDGNGHKIIAADDIVADTNYTVAAQTNVLSVGSMPEGTHIDGVMVKDVTIVASAASRNLLNPYDASVTIEGDVVLDHSNATTGAPLMVNKSDVTVAGNLDAVTGDASWYAASVSGENSALTVADGATFDMTGTGPNVLVADKTAKVDMGASGEQLADGTYGEVAARIGDAAYNTLETAVAAVKDGETIDLVADVEVAKCLEVTVDNVTINGNGHTITAAKGIASNASGNAHLLEITGEGATVKDVTLLGTSETKHALNIWCADTATLENVTLNHSASATGAPLVVNNTDVTVKGDFEVISGTGSWYGVNLDNKYGPTTLTFAEDSNVKFNDVSGKDLAFIKIENTAEKPDGSMPSIVNESSSGVTTEDGVNFGIHTHVAGAPENYVAPTVDAEGYTGDTYCTVCGELLTKGEAIPTIEPDDVVMFRLYNPWTGEHFYTSSDVERDANIELGWRYEGVGWIAPGKGAEVYRMYNPYVTGGDHHYTMSAEERDSLVEAGWKYEGVAWYSADKETGVPVLREYNPFATTGTHNYTISQDEHDNLVSLGWKDEGIAWYAAQ